MNLCSSFLISGYRKDSLPGDGLATENFIEATILKLISILKCLKKNWLRILGRFAFSKAAGLLSLISLRNEFWNGYSPGISLRLLEFLFPLNTFLLLGILWVNLVKKRKDFFKKHLKVLFWICIFDSSWWISVAYGIFFLFLFQEMF